MVLCNLLQLRDKREFRSMLRMNEEAYTFLLQQVTPYIQRKDTNWRKAIPPDERLCVALQFLAFGKYFTYNMVLNVPILGKYSIALYTI